MPEYESAGLTTRLFIDGAWCDSSSGNTIQIHNPARPQEIVGSITSASVDDIERACAAAHKAFPRWAGLSYAERADHLVKIAHALRSDVDELAARTRLFTREHGKILREAALELTRLGERFLLTASYADRLSREMQLPGPPFDTVIFRQPRGVAALIVPWNWPLSILGAKLPQALLAGNTVVVKPSKESSLTPALTIKRMAEILPPGVIDLVTGSSAIIGDPLIAHPLVRKINFTGSVDVGRHVMSRLKLTPVTLELGGNDALSYSRRSLGRRCIRKNVYGNLSFDRADLHGVEAPLCPQDSLRRGGVRAHQNRRTAGHRRRTVTGSHHGPAE